MQNKHSILRLPDSIDPMDADVRDIDTSWPVLAEGTKDMVIKVSEKKEVKDRPGHYNLALQLQTTKDETGNKGQVIPKGHVFSVFYPITPAPERQSDDGKYTIKAVTNSDIARNIAGPCKAAGLAITPRAFLDNVGVLQGKSVRVEIGIRKAKDGFPAQNTVSEWIALK